MKKIHYILITIIILGIAGAGYYIYQSTNQSDSNITNDSQTSSINNNDQTTIAQKSLDQYKRIWRQTFINYQTNVSSIPKFGTYLFKISLSYTGNKSEMEEFQSLYTFGEEFNTIGAAIGGDYDISDSDNMTLDLKFSAFIDKKIEGDGDIDLDIKFDGDKNIQYRYNAMNSKILKILSLPSDQVKILVDEYKEKKSQWLESSISSTILKDIFGAVQSESEDSPLIQNTAEEEQAIINAFLNREVINITKGESLKNFDRLHFLLDTSALTEFAKDVNIILGNTGAENKSFDGDKEMLDKLYLGGYLDINKNIIIDSNIKLGLPLTATKKGKQVAELMSLETALKFPDPGKLDFEISTRIRNASNEESKNKLTLIIKGKIK